MTTSTHTTEVWAQLLLSRTDRDKVHDFFMDEWGIEYEHLVRRLHITVYHARRPMPDVHPITERINLSLDASETRFMDMAPGGENPGPEHDPARRKVGIRVHHKSAAMPEIQTYRTRLLKHETQKVLGRRKPSNNKSSAFGARHFQPHMVLLRGGSGMQRDLTELGENFWEAIRILTFDRFVIDVVERQPEPKTS